MKTFHSSRYVGFLKSLLETTVLSTIAILLLSFRVNAQIKVRVTVSVDGIDPNTNVNYTRDYDTFLKARSLFVILPQEAVARIPVCVSSTWNRNEHYFALTDSDGIAEFTINPGECTSCWGVSANPSAGSCTGHASDFRPDFTSTYQGILNLADAAQSKNRTVNVVCRLYYSGYLITAWETILQLIPRMPAMDHQRVKFEIDNIMGTQTPVAHMYPTSCAVMRAKLLATFEQARQATADDEFSQKHYNQALPVYNDLLANFPDSPSYKRDREKKDSCETLLRAKSVCDSLVNAGSFISNPTKALAYFRSSLAKISPNDPCYDELQANIQRLESELQSQKEQAEENQMRDQDARAIKKFKVDETITQVDLFKNPFAFEGKCILMTCTVYKFETPTSAIMDGLDRFYAHFKVTPPKKFSALYLIVRVKGTTTLVNAFGTPIKVPLVDVVHILNLPPEQDSGDN